MKRCPNEECSRAKLIANEIHLVELQDFSPIRRESETYPAFHCIPASRLAVVQVADRISRFATFLGFEARLCAILPSLTSPISIILS